MKVADVETGEVHLVGIIKKPKFKEPFVMIFQRNALEVARNKSLTARELRVLFGVLGHVDFENELHELGTELAAALGMDQPGLSKALTKLADTHGLLDRVPGKRGRYRLSPLLAFRGNPRQHQAALEASGF